MLSGREVRVMGIWILQEEQGHWLAAADHENQKRHKTSWTHPAESEQLFPVPCDLNVQCGGHSPWPSR